MRGLWSKIDLARLWRAAGWLIAAAITLLSLIPLAGGDSAGSDKLGHLLAYGALMAWWSQLNTATAARIRLGLVFIALGAAMELAQGLTPTRSPEWADLAADAIGVLLGWLAAPPRIPNFYTKLAAAFPATPR